MIKKLQLIDNRILEVDNTCVWCKTNTVPDKWVLINLNLNKPIICFQCNTKLNMTEGYKKDKKQKKRLRKNLKYLKKLR